MPKPAKGRVVHVFVDPHANGGDDIAPAIITRVWDDKRVNVRVLLDGPGPDTPWIAGVSLFDQRPTAEELLEIEDYHFPSGALVPGAAFWPPHV